MLRLSSALLLLAFLLVAAPSAGADTVLTLDEAFAQTRAHNDDLESFLAAWERSRAGRGKALALMLPTLQAGATFTVNDGEVTIGQSVVTRQYDYAGSASLSLRLFDGSAIPLLKSACQRVERARAAVHQAERERIGARYQVQTLRDVLASVIGVDPSLDARLVRPACLFRS